MAIYRTANLNVLQTWLIGGQVDIFGTWRHSIQCFMRYRTNTVMTDGKIDLNKVKASIVQAIDNYGDENFNYWGKVYRFKTPSNKNLTILAKRIAKLKKPETN